MYAEGDGVEQSPVEAYKWFTLAFNQGLEEALTERSKLIKANGMGLDDIIAAKNCARFQTQQVMKLAGLAIGILLAAGQVWAADLNATLKKAEAGDATSQYQLAEHYAEADGVDQDYEEL